MRVQRAVYTMIIWLISGLAYSAENCGSKEGFYNELAATALIPDCFPPESPLLENLVSSADYNRCADQGFAFLGRACRIHDRCYDVQIDKNYCDNRLRSEWQQACRQTYNELSFDSQICKLACLTFVEISSKAQTYNRNGICPSCDAYEGAAQ
ncbi:MAG: hypothetical protein HRU19_31235 [Pseudobacteriovorax sp.]|nr:hypothetical protein [Pseudobacteriovorax sp.]